MKTRQKLTYSFLLLTAIIVVANLLSSGLFFRLDFTADSRYTLSSATKSILENIDEPVTITAYFSVDLPPHIAKNRQDFKEMLEEYSAVSGGNIVYEFKNPNENPEIEQEAMQKGIQPFLINVREKDQVKQQKAYMGAQISYGDKEEALPFIPLGGAMEYSLSSSIKKVILQERKSVALLQGHGEPGINAFQQVMQELQVVYDVEPVTLTDTANNLNQYETVLIVAPTDSFPSWHLTQLDAFLKKGGNMLVAINRVGGDLSKAQGYEITTGLETWLEEKGIQVENNFMIDASCGNVMVAQNTGMYRMQSQVMFPYMPVIKNFADHPITKGLESVLLQFASPINYVGDTSVTVTALLKSSDNADTQPPTTFFDVQKQWTKRDFNKNNLVGAALFESKSTTNPMKMVVFGDGNFPVNGEGQSAMQQQADNIHLFVNAIDYLSDDTGLIGLRTKGVTSRPIDELEDGTKAILKYLNFLLPLLLVIGYGVVRAQKRKIKRIKRMQKGFID
ncbi:MAG: Gldg family protein [Salinivirgaceae bacterium]|nr:Gldg family protein [Salinivirgaceae bacterium]